MGHGRCPLPWPNSCFNFWVLLSHCVQVGQQSTTPSKLSMILSSISIKFPNSKVIGYFESLKSMVHQFFQVFRVNGSWVKSLESKLNGSFRSPLHFMNLKS
jgi:hypothetical protein